MRLFIASLLTLSVAACGGDALTGTWKDPGGSIPLPQTLGGTPVAANETVVFNGNVTPKTVDITIAVTFGGASDTIEAKGTYTDSGSSLALTITGFTSASGDPTEVSADGSSQCIKIGALGDAELCVKSPQTNSYTIVGGTLSTSVSDTVGGVANDPIPLSLSKS